MTKAEEFRADDTYQPELEGFRDAYTVQPGDKIPPEKVEHIMQVVAAAGAEHTRRYYADQKRMAKERARQHRVGRGISKFLRPLGAR